MLPPETPAGAGSPAPAAAPAGAAAPASPSGAAATPHASEQPFRTPADDLQARYTDLESRYNTAREYADAGRDTNLTPAQIRESIAWARERAAELQAGKLTYAEQKAIERAEKTADPFDRWEDMTPREQAQLLREDARATAKAARDEITAEMRKPLDALAQENRIERQIFMQASRLSAETGVPFEEAVQEATRIASLNSHDLIKLAFDNKLSPKKQQQLIDQRVQEALALAQQERDKLEADSLMVRTGKRFLTEPTNIGERRTQARGKIMGVISKELQRVRQGGAQ